MSRKLKLAVKEKHQTKMSKFTEQSTLSLQTKQEKTLSDNTDSSVMSISTLNPLDDKCEPVASTKRKRFQESTPPNKDQAKKIIMSISPQENESRSILRK